MPNLKDFKTRIGSVKSTRKITSAMKMVAASKLRRAQEQAEAARPYSARLESMMRHVATKVENFENAPPLLVGTGKEKTILLIVFTSDRGLCGAFNGHIVRETRKIITELEEEGKTVRLLMVGKKGAESLQRDHKDKILYAHTDLSHPRPNFEDAGRISFQILDLFDQASFDTAHIIYNRFISVITQKVTVQQIVPISFDNAAEEEGEEEVANLSTASYEFEPEEEKILHALLPRNLTVQIFKGLLESAASEHGARMAAMDAATRNAGDMIKNLTLEYNKARQAYITTEIIEIVSGAEALKG